MLLLGCGNVRLPVVSKQRELKIDWKIVIRVRERHVRAIPLERNGVNVELMWLILCGCTTCFGIVFCEGKIINWLFHIWVCVCVSVWKLHALLSGNSSAKNEKEASERVHFILLPHQNDSAQEARYPHISGISSDWMTRSEKFRILIIHTAWASLSIQDYYIIDEMMTTVRRELAQCIVSKN